MKLNARQALRVCIAAGILVSGALIFAVIFADRSARRDAAIHTNPLGNPAGMVDALVFLEDSTAWLAGEFEHTRVDTDGWHLGLGVDSDGEFPRQGRWTSAPVAASFRFTELIPSWNALVPTGSGIAVSVRVRDGANWSPWLYFGGWGREPAVARTTRYDHGVVHTDTLVLDRPADAWQVRVHFVAHTFDPAGTPRLRRVAVSYSGVVADEKTRLRLSPPPKVEGVWARSLDVPYRTQQDTPKPLRSQTCSPTSVSMVLAYWGYDRPTVENALAIYDPEPGRFGNWNRAVQRAGELGLDAWLTRFRSWEGVKAQIALGRPVIASIRFEQGAFPAAALQRTSGHVIVIRGFTASGDAVVNDPANARKGNAAVYPAADLARAWFNHGGVGYVIVGPAKSK